MKKQETKEVKSQEKRIKKEVKKENLGFCQGL